MMKRLDLRAVLIDASEGPRRGELLELFRPQAAFLDGSNALLKGVLPGLLDEAVANVLLHHFLWGGGVRLLRGAQHDGHVRWLDGDLDAFYGAPPPSPELDARCLRSGGTSAHRIYDVSFPSPVHTGFAANDRVWLRHWKCRRGVPSAVLGLDGLVQVGSYWWGRLASLLAPHGIDVVMMDEPFNFRRTPRGFRPGQLILGGDLWHQLAVLRQAVLDAWSAVRGLRCAGYEVGVVGLSFGGLLALLAATVIPDLRFAIALIPPADPASLLRHRGQFRRALKKGIAATGIRRHAFWRAVRPVRPILWQPLVPHRRIHLHAARWDRFVPNEPIERLAAAWKTRFTLHDGGHVAVSMARRVAAEVAKNIVEWSSDSNANDR